MAGDSISLGLTLTSNSVLPNPDLDFAPECVFLTLPLYESSVFQSPRLESLELPLTRSHLLPLLLSFIASCRSFLPHLSQPSSVLCSNLRGFFQLPNPPPFGNPLTYSLCAFF